MIVSVHELSHSYAGRPALSGLSFSVQKGEIYGILGPNGGGKSTVFRILATIMAPDSGKVTIAGFDPVNAPGEVRRRIGVVFQSASLDRKLTVKENLHSQGHLYGLRGKSLDERASECIRRLGLQGREDDLVDTLSGGLKRRVEIAKALLHQPAVLLLDEPSTGLDPGARRELTQYLEDLRRRLGTTIILTTHILDDAERCDRLLLIHNGRRVTEGSPAELKSRVGGDVVVLESPDPQGLAESIRERFHVSGQVVDGRLRVEIAGGHRFLAEVVEAFPGMVSSLALHRPTLEDVFLDETGVAIC